MADDAVARLPCPPWLDDVIAKISFIYLGEFKLVSIGRFEDYTEKHGSCFRCTYKFVFNDGVQQKLPNEDGDRLMKLIKQASKIAEANPPLVPTKIKGQHDFSDWGWTPTGAEMWIFLEVPKDPQKRGLNRA